MRGPSRMNTASHSATLAQDPQLRSALALLHTLLEHIADAPLESLFEAARVSELAADDEELRKWRIAVGRYPRCRGFPSAVYKVLLDADYVTEHESSARAESSACGASCERRAACSTTRSIRGISMPWPTRQRGTGYVTRAAWYRTVNLTCL